MTDITVNLTSDEARELLSMAVAGEVHTRPAVPLTQGVQRLVEAMGKEAMEARNA